MLNLDPPFLNKSFIFNLEFFLLMLKNLLNSSSILTHIVLDCMNVLVDFFFSKIEFHDFVKEQFFHKDQLIHENWRSDLHSRLLSDFSNKVLKWFCFKI